MTATTPAAQLAQLINGFWMTQAIYVAAKLRLADHLAASSQTAEQLARIVNVQPVCLYRLLRALSSMGVFVEDDARTFSLTPMSEALRTNVPGSLLPMALMRGEWQYQAWGELLHCVTTGGSAFERLFGQPMFDFLADDPERGALFDAAMTSIHGRETALLLDAFDFSSFGKVFDIGGGNGSLLGAILRKHSNLQGTLFDLPHVVERARTHSSLSNLHHRVEFFNGSFFDSIPSGGDVYLLRHIIHDWDDEQSNTILRNCRAAMSPTSKLLIAEFVIPPGNDPFLGKWFDLAMLVGPGGQERTAVEYEQLFKRAGLKLTRIVATAGEISLIEGVIESADRSTPAPASCESA